MSYIVPIHLRISTRGSDFEILIDPEDKIEPVVKIMEVLSDPKCMKIYSMDKILQVDNSRGYLIITNLLCEHPTHERIISSPDGSVYPRRFEYILDSNNEISHIHFEGQDKEFMEIFDVEKMCFTHKIVFPQNSQWFQMSNIGSLDITFSRPYLNDIRNINGCDGLCSYIFSNGQYQDADGRVECEACTNVQLFDNYSSKVEDFIICKFYSGSRDSLCFLGLYTEEGECLDKISIDESTKFFKLEHCDAVIFWNKESVKFWQLHTREILDISKFCVVDDDEDVESEDDEVATIDIFNVSQICREDADDMTFRLMKTFYIPRELASIVIEYLICGV